MAATEEKYYWKGGVCPPYLNRDCGTSWGPSNSALYRQRLQQQFALVNSTRQITRPSKTAYVPFVRNTPRPGTVQLTGPRNGAQFASINKKAPIPPGRIVPDPAPIDNYPQAPYYNTYYHIFTEPRPGTRTARTPLAEATLVPPSQLHQPKPPRQSITSRPASQGGYTLYGSAPGQPQPQTARPPSVGDNMRIWSVGNRPGSRPSTNSSSGSQTSRRSRPSEFVFFRGVCSELEPAGNSVSGEREKLSRLHIDRLR